MSDDVKSMLELLHKKQDSQTEKLNDLSISVAKQEVLSDNYAKQSDKMAEELRKMNEHMAVYNAELKVHIAGVLELKEQNNLMRTDIQKRDEILNARLEVAERPIKWFETTYKWMKWLGAVGTAGTLMFAVVKWLAAHL